MIRRPPRSTQSRSSAASDVYKRQGPESLGLASVGQPVIEHAQEVVGGGLVQADPRALVGETLTEGLVTDEVCVERGQQLGWVDVGELEDMSTNRRKGVSAAGRGGAVNPEVPVPRALAVIDAGVEGPGPERGVVGRRRPEEPFVGGGPLVDLPLDLGSRSSQDDFCLLYTSPS